MNLSDRILALDEFAARKDDSKFRAAVLYAEARAQALPIRPKTVILESTGRRIAGVPLVMFEHMVGDPVFADYEFVWVVKGASVSPLKPYLADPRVRTVGFRTREYAQALWTAAYLVNDRAWPPFFTKRPGQVGAIAWSAAAPHAQKTLARGSEELKGTARSLLHADFLIAPDSDTAAALLEAAGADRIFGGRVLTGTDTAAACEAMIAGAPSADALPPEGTAKTRVIVIGCDFGDSPATFQAIGLSHHMDHERFDLTFLVSGKTVPGRQRRLAMLHPSARVLFTFGHRPLTQNEYVALSAHRALAPAERCAPAAIAAVTPHYERERHRMLGDTAFDVAIGFTDRLSDATLLLSCASFARRVLCLTDPADQAGRRLTPELVADRFDRVLVIPQASESRIARALAQAGAPPLVAVDRFSGYEMSVAALRDEVAEQLAESLGHAQVPAGIDAALDSLAAEVLRRLDAAQRGYGLDADAHDREVAGVYQRVLETT